MKLETIALNNLRRRKGRVAFLVAGLLIGVATVVALMSLSSALTMEAQHKMEKFGANILITPKADNLSLSYGGITLGGVTVDAAEIRQVDLENIKGIPNYRNVAAIAPKVLGVVEVDNQRVLLMGVDQEREFHLKKWWSVEGRPLASENELVAGFATARILGLQAGDEVVLDGQRFVLTGILRETGSQDDHLLIAALPTAQALLGKQGIVSLVEIAALCADCPVEDMVNQLSTALPDVSVNAIQQVVKTRMHALEQFRIFSLAVAGVVVLIGSLVVFVTMMGSVNERTREIGIFRALGFRSGHVMRLILIESTTVSFIAGCLGYLFGMLISIFSLPMLSEGAGHIAWNIELAAGAILLAVVVGNIASFYPALHASRLQPTEALRAL